MARDEDARGTWHKTLGAVTEFLLMFPAVAAAVVLGGVVAFKYWQWFVVPVFHPPVNPGVLEFLGLQMFYAAFKRVGKTVRRDSEDEKEREYPPLAQMGIHIVGALFALLFGWLMHLYVVGPDPAWLSRWVGF